MRGGWVFWVLLALVLVFAVGAARAQTCNACSSVGIGGTACTTIGCGPFAPAQSSGACAPGCTQESCSNDPAGNPAASRTAGDEDFSVCLGGGTPDCPTGSIEIQRAETGVTITAAPNVDTVQLNGTSLFDPDTLDAGHPDGSVTLVTIRARSCSSSATCGFACSPWSAGVVYLFHACLRSLPAYENPRRPGDWITPACEYRCGPTAPYRLSNRYPACS